MSTQPRTRTPTFALLIGISDYSVHEDSRRSPRGSSALPAGKNDALAFLRICGELGIAPENIHILTSPALAAGGTGGSVPGYAGPATRAEIEAQLVWLSSQLARDAGSEGAPVGLLAYSGHGDFAGEELALCPSDVRAKPGAGPTDDLENVVGFDRVDEILRAHPGAAENVTVVLDCCHASAAAAWGPGRRSSLTGRGPSPSQVAPRSLGRSLLMAAEPGELARQGMFGGRAHGACTWALSAVADTWRAHSDRGAERLTISQGDLVRRAQRLLDALSIPQSLWLRGWKAAQEQCFVHRGNVPSVLQPTRGCEPVDPDIGTSVPSQGSMDWYVWR